jgi:hypothetical protein
MSLSSCADACIGNGNVYDDLSCAARDLDQSEKDLNAIYRKIHASMQCKDEFEQV